MKKILFVTAILLSFMPLALFGEDVKIISGSGSSAELTTAFPTTEGQVIHYQMIYPASLFHKQTATKKQVGGTDGYDIDFEYIKGIKLFISSTDLPQDYNLQAKVRMWVQTDRDHYASQDDFISVPDNAYVLYDNFVQPMIGENTRLYNEGTTASSSISFSRKDAFLDYTSTGNIVVDIEFASGTSGGIVWKTASDGTNSEYHFRASTGTGTVSACQPEIEFSCCRVVKDVIIGQGRYDLHTDNYWATLLKYDHTGSMNLDLQKLGVNNTTDVNGKIPEDRKSIKNLDFVYHVDVPSIVSFTDAEIQGNDKNEFAVEVLGSDVPFYNSVGADLVFVLPSSITHFGLDGEDNKCFNVSRSAGISGNTPTVTFVYTGENYPKICGSGFSSFTQPNCTTNFFFRHTINEPADQTGTQNFTYWTTNLASKFYDFGFCSYLYNVDYSKDKYFNVKTGENSVVTTVFSILPPYGNYPFEIQIDPSIDHKNYDGTVHYYTGFEQSKMSDGDLFKNLPVGNCTFSTTSDGKPTFSCTISGNCAIPVVTTGYACVKYDVDGQYLSGGDISVIKGPGENDFSDYKFLERCDSLTFKKPGGTDVSKYPQFEFRNAPENIDYLRTTTDIYVEKEISNKEYSFFSMPFDCNVSDIEVKYNNVVSSKNSATDSWMYNTNNILPFLADDFATVSLIESDSYVIYKYVGQDDETGGEAKYVQITNQNEVLQANRGYAFVIAESDDNYKLNTDNNDLDGDYVLNFEVTATIKFKYNATSDQEKHIYKNDYSGFSYTASTSTENTASTGISFPILFASGPTNKNPQNRNWNLVGNPFYHTIKASAFGKYITNIGNAAEGSKNVVHRSTVADQNRQFDILPFTAFFIQAKDENGNLSDIKIDPTKVKYETSSAPSMAKAPAERQEVVSVNFCKNDTVLDYTAIIDDATRDREFRIGDDLAKMFNPCGQICSYFDSVKCAFKELAMREDSTMRTIPLGIKVVEEGTYTFAIDTARNYFHGAVVLHDKQMNQFYNLTAQGVSFELTPGMDVTRFELVVEPSEIPAGEEAIVGTSETLDAYVYDGRLVVENIEDGSTLSIFDASGRMLYSAPAAGSFDYDFGVRGVYMVVVSGNTTGSIKVVY